jgi:hypothetical protein
MRARTMTLILPLLLLAFGLTAGCNDGDRTQMTGGDATPVATGTAAPTVAATPSLELLGVAAVTQAVAARDVDALVARIQYTTVPCIDAPQGIPAPPRCAAVGVPSGARVETLPALLCEGEYVPRTVVPAFLRQQLERGSLELHGVLDVGTAPYAFPADFPAAGGWPTPEYAVIYRPTTPGLDLGFYLASGRIVALRSFGICGPALPPAADPAWRVAPTP